MPISLLQANIIMPKNRDYDFIRQNIYIKSYVLEYGLHNNVKVYNIETLIK